MFRHLNIGRTRRRLLIDPLESRQLLTADAIIAVNEVAEGESNLVADFSLTDVNPNSATYNQSISPRDYLGQTSVWYFGHST
ncbi:MAG: hypothetical protein CMJ80_03480 [Planctomycetaceae bacterium]|nr:hypothetical protein [Planctomycetaceae bacterium]